VDGRRAILYCVHRRTFLDLTKLFKEPHPLSSPPSYAFFGPIFYASRQGMEKMQSAGFLNFAPQNKTEAQVTEQVWSPGLADPG
jgi:hypothetical protein